MTYYSTCLLVLGLASATAQTVYVPSGTSGIGTSTNNNVGIGTGMTVPTEKLDIGGYDKVNIRVGQWATLGIVGSHLSTVLGNNVKASSTNPNMEVLLTANQGAKAIKLQYNEGITFHTLGVPVTGGTAFSSERMRIDNTGNVGIGTTSPTSKFEVIDGPQSIRLLTGSISSGYRLDIGVNDNGVNFSNNSSIRGFNFVNTAGTIMSMSADGKVGIGTTTPAEKLHIMGSIRGNGPGESLRINTPTGYLDVGSVNASWAHFYTDRPNFYFNRQVVAAGGFGSYATNDLILTTNFVEKIRVINSTGNVGIGTANPGTAKLAVKGTIHGEEVKVDLTVPGPDYVFEKNYQLPGLDDVASYILENKHLPEIPSAKEMEADGIKLGEMNMLLLKKIEELTLYVIELKSENELLNKRVSKLEK